MGDMLAALELGEDLSSFLAQLGGDDLDDGLADHLLWLIAEDARRACIPRRDASIESLADDGVVGRHHDSRKPRGFDFRTASGPLRRLAN
jgi:hypothetical protein